MVSLMVTLLPTYVLAHVAFERLWTLIIAHKFSFLASSNKQILKMTCDMCVFYKWSQKPTAGFRYYSESSTALGYGASQQPGHVLLCLSAQTWVNWAVLSVSRGPGLACVLFHPKFQDDSAHHHYGDC